MHGRQVTMHEGLGEGSRAAQGHWGRLGEGSRAAQGHLGKPSSVTIFCISIVGLNKFLLSFNCRQLTTISYCHLTEFNKIDNNEISCNVVI